MNVTLSEVTPGVSHLERCSLDPYHHRTCEGLTMAEKTFEIRTEPHVASVGKTQLLFQAEVIGAEFAQAYGELRAVQQKVKGNKASSTKHAKEEATDPAVLIELHEAMRSFIRGFLLPESQTVFDGLRLPDRILIALMEWTAELYGSGAGKDQAPADAPGGQSSD